MRRADRLFRIIQALRGARRPLTAARLADRFETSLRTIYRDIAELQAQHVPIRGEAGVGYVLDPGYDMPPLMLTADEIDAVLLGAQWVRARGDAVLSAAAADLIAKVVDVVPAHLRPIVLGAATMVPEPPPQAPDAIDMQRVRESIRRLGKIRLGYADADGVPSERVIWPIAVAYFDTARLLVGWCELRGCFRNFRTDRIRDAEFLDETFPGPRARLITAWEKQEFGDPRRTARPPLPL